MANGPLSRGLARAGGLLSQSGNLDVQRGQLDQRKQEGEINSAFKMVNLGIDLEDDDLTQSGINTVNEVFGTTIDVSSIAADRKAFQKQMNRLVEEGNALGQDPSGIPAFQQALSNFNAKFSGTKRFGERAKEIVTGGQEQVKRTAGVTALGEEATQSELAQLQAGEGVGAVLKRREPAGGGTKTAQNFRLPNGEIVLSRDGGRTYTSKGGEVTPIPPGTIKIPGGASLAELTAGAARKEAAEELAEGEDTKTGKTFQRTAEEAAESGTGPFANLKAAFNAVAGGLGIDRAFGLNGFFPETQQSRQFLRLIKQTGKAALLNSARGAIWEQEKIDKLFADPGTFWVNPDTESNKFPLIREVLNEEKNFNLQAIQTSTPKEIVTLRKSNRDIDRLLNLIGPQGEQAQQNVTTVTMPDGTTQTFDAQGARIQ